LDGKVTKLEGVAKADLRRGAAKVNLVLPDDKTRSLQATWVQELDNGRLQSFSVSLIFFASSTSKLLLLFAEIPKIQTNMKAAWDGNKELKVDFKGEGNKELNDFKINLGTSSQMEEKHKAEINIRHKVRTTTSAHNIHFLQRKRQCWLTWIPR